MVKTAITPTRDENYPDWYQQVVQAADLAENSPVRGCMVIKPWGYGIWENLQQKLDQMIKATGHVNAYFPLLIPLKQMEQEAAHVDGFAKECAVVTHHRLESDGEGGLKPAGELEEPYIVRPTSETTVGVMYSKWVQSYRDLPILINQWSNVMRWEMRTRLFLRTAEFLWQEGHTAHATAEEAMEETRKMSQVYADLAEKTLAIPVIQGEKTISERFPGAVNTYTIEAMMQDGKALQSGTSHFLGQNFSKAYDIDFLNQHGEKEHAWTTSWGLSTRMIGGLIMVHSDDNGLVLPPKVAPQQVVILPIYKTDDERKQILDFCQQIQSKLDDLRVHIDDRDLRGGEKNWQWIKKGVPLRIEVGPRDLANKCVMLARRDADPKEKTSLSAESFVANAAGILDEIQQNLFNRAKAYLQKKTVSVSSIDEFNEFFAKETGFIECYAIDDPSIDDKLKSLKVTPRCIPLNQENRPGKCIFTGQETDKKIIFAKAY